MEQLISYTNALAGADKNTITLALFACLAIKLVEKNIDVCIERPDGTRVALKFS